MISERQMAANRRNAQNSTGPRTAEGKARSRLNAWKHGLSGHTIVVGPEQQDQFQTFHDDLLKPNEPISTASPPPILVSLRLRVFAVKKHPHLLRIFQQSRDLPPSSPFW